MKVSFYFSLILGIAFLTLRFIGLFLDLTYNLFLALGLFLLLGVSLPLHLYERYRYRQKMNEIIRDHKIKGSKAKSSEKKPGSSEKKIQEYPSFRNQKQGLNWGGGNIHGSAATRGSKRSFLKK